jgi:hypothetical protein
VRLTAAEPVELGLQVGELYECLEELVAVAVGILPEPGQTVLGSASGFLDCFGPLFGGEEPRPKAVVLLLEAGRAPPLRPEIAPEREWLVEVGGHALSVGALALGLRPPLPRPTDLASPARTGRTVLDGHESREYPDGTKPTYTATVKICECFRPLPGTGLE